MIAILLFLFSVWATPKTKASDMVSPKKTVTCPGEITQLFAGMNLYQQLLDVSKQRGQLFTTARCTENQSSMERSVIKMFKAMCEENYKPFEAYLKIGSYTKLEAVPIALFPEPLPFTTKDAFGNEKTRFVSNRFEVCGYIKIADLVGFGGSPESFSRNVVFPRVESSHKKVGSELDKLESEMKQFFAKSATADDEESSSSMPNPDVTTKESAVVLLHGALKVENCAAVVLLADGTVKNYFFVLNLIL